MATISFKNGDEYLGKIAKLEAALKDEICGAAIYGAAGIVADEIRSQLKAVPTDEGYGTASEPTRGPKTAQKEALLDALGISSMEEKSGYYDVKIGFDGYNGIKTKRWPNGQPNQMVARSIERGTSWMKANAFVKKAMAATRKRALEFMKHSVDESIRKIMEK